MAARVLKTWVEDFVDEDTGEVVIYNSVCQTFNIDSTYHLPDMKHKTVTVIILYVTCELLYIHYFRFFIVVFFYQVVEKS